MPHQVDDDRLRAERDDSRERWLSYFYDGDDFLGAMVNKLGQRDPIVLEAVEYRIAGSKAFEIRAGKIEIPQTFDLDHYLGIHKALLGDVYAWAGTVRDVDLIKDGSAFTPFEEIPARFARAQQLVADTDWRQLSRHEVAVGFAEVYNVVNDAHACREGNGRTTRMFMSDVATRAGYEFHEETLSRTELIAGAIAGARGDLTPLTELFETHCTREASRAQQLAAATSQAPSTTLRQRLDHLYGSRVDGVAAESRSLAARIAALERTPPTLPSSPTGVMRQQQVGPYL